MYSTPSDFTFGRETLTVLRRGYDGKLHETVKSIPLREQVRRDRAAAAAKAASK